MPSRARSPQPDRWQPGERFRVGELITPEGAGSERRPQPEPERERMFEPPTMVKECHLVISDRAKVFLRRVPELNQTLPVLTSPTLEAAVQVVAEAAARNVRVTHIFLDSRRAQFAASGEPHVEKTCAALEACNPGGYPMRTTLVVMPEAGQLSPNIKADFEARGVRVLEGRSSVIGKLFDHTTAFGLPGSNQQRADLPKDWDFDNTIK